MIGVVIRLMKKNEIDQSMISQVLTTLFKAHKLINPNFREIVNFALTKLSEKKSTDWQIIFTDALIYKAMLIA
jgi:hypothetical protein